MILDRVWIATYIIVSLTNYLIYYLVRGLSLVSYSKKFVVYDIYSPFTYGSMANPLVNMMRTSIFDETG